MMKLRLTVAAVALLAKSLDAGSWPSFRRDQGRTAFAYETAAPPLTQRWVYDSGFATVSSPVKANGFVYFGSRNGKVYALDAKTGVLKWTYQTGDWVDSTPSVADGKVFVNSRDGNLYVLNAANGTLLWKYATGSRDVSSPAVLYGEVYTATAVPQKKLLVLDENTGTLKRSAVLSQFTGSSPVIDTQQGYVYLGTSDGRYSAWNFALLPQWGAPPQTRGAIYFATPALTQGQVIAAAGDDDWAVHAFDAGSGNQIWVSQFLSNTVSQATSVAASTRSAFVGAGYSPQSLYALNLANGNVQWSVALATVGLYGLTSSPGVAADLVYIESPKGVSAQSSLMAISAYTGAVMANMPLASDAVASPAVSDGWVYAMNVDGKVYGFQAGRAVSIVAPDSVNSVVDGGVVVVTATVASPTLQGYRVEYGTGTEPSQWTLLAQGNQPVTEAAVATWDTRGFPENTYTLRLTAQETSASGYVMEARQSFVISPIHVMTLSVSSDTVFTLSDGTEIVIPAGAWPTTDTLIVKSLVPGEYSLGTPPNVSATSLVRQFKLASTEHPKFSKQITIKMPYSTVQYKNESYLRLYYFDDNSQDWKMVNTSDVRKDEKRVWAKLDHFTVFQIMEYKPNGELIPGGEIYTYPNPATGNTLTFKFRPGDTSDIRIRVFDVSGQLVADLSKLGNPAGIASTLDWDISGRASGVYIYRAQVTSINGQKGEVTKKLAIIH